MAKPKKEPPEPKPRENAPDEVNEHGDYIKIGGSPVPGLTLRHVLRGHTDTITRIAWSLDGKYLASPSDDKTIRIWNSSIGIQTILFEGHDDEVRDVTWSPINQKLASGGKGNQILIWEAQTGKILQTLDGYSKIIPRLAYSPDGQILAVEGQNRKIELWNTNTWKILRKLKGHSGFINCLNWSPDGKLLISGASNEDKNAMLWNPNNGKLIKTLIGNQEINALWSAAWSSDGRLMVTGNGGNEIHIWDTDTWWEKIILEGHTNVVTNFSFSFDSSILLSQDIDNTLILWQTKTWQKITTISFPSTANFVRRASFHPKLPVIATTTEEDTVICIWDMDVTALLGASSSFSSNQQNINYTTAKLVLVGDSGVGKTGLGWRLAHGEFKEHASTHGQQFWSIPQLNLKRKDGTDCEAVLWDLAGQHVYRQVHSIFLENVAAALVLFDPTNRQEPLKGAQFWLEQLKGKGQLPPTVLVGARVDRGVPALSQAELDQFCQRYGIKGGYISTSALKGDGLAELLEIVKAQIPWDAMTATVTTVTFKRIKDYVLSLKEKTDRKGVLVSPAELRAQLETFEVSETSKVWTFTDAEMMTAVGHLDTHGYVTVLRNSAGEQTILLTPDLLVNLAASIMLLADKNPRELGAVSETELLQGKYPFDELKGLEPREAQTLLDAAILRFLEHNICFRETLGYDTLLIFPSLIKQKRPLQDDLPATDDISYIVRGRVENLYASLVVLLGYTPTFTRINQWQNQAQYEMRQGEICGFRMIEEREGEIELVLYYGEKLPQSGRDKFQELFEQFLYQRDVDVTRFPPVICPKGHRLERTTVVKRVREGRNFVHCDECGEKTFLPDFNQPQTIGLGASPWLQREEAIARLRSAYEKHLTNIKSYRRNWAIPRCYVSHLPQDAERAEKLIHDLQDAGVFVIKKTEKVQSDDFLILLDRSALQKAYQSAASALETDFQLIQERLKSGNKKVLALACEGTPHAHTFRECKSGEFCDETHYPVSLFDLVLNLYAIPLNHQGFTPLRQALHGQWEQTLAGKEVIEMRSALKIFISYSHKDEEFKDELVTMLAGLQRRGIVDTWHDRRIEAGDEWYTSIQNAMDECDLALLLISRDYLASRFIQVEEQPKLLKRREEMKLRVIPIIVRSCLWQSEPIIKDIQAMPKDGKAVNSFSKDNDERDQVWTTIAQEIEKRAKAKARL